jgi:hypothetical protein
MLLCSAPSSFPDHAASSTPRFNAQAELELHGRCTFPKPDLLERADEIGGFLSLPCNFSKPFLYERESLVI